MTFWFERRENEEANSIFNMVFMGSSLAWNVKVYRVHEMESDKMGLVYEVSRIQTNEAIAFWEKCLPKALIFLKSSVHTQVMMKDKRYQRIY